MIDSLSLTLFTITIILLLIWFVVRKRHMSLLSRCGIPGPKPDFWFGHLKYLRQDEPKSHEKWLKQYGKIVGYYFGTKPMVLVADTQLLKQIQIKDFHKFSDRFILIDKGVHAYPGELKHLIFEKGSKWKQMRSILTPTFSSSKLKTMVPVIEGAIDVFMKKLDTKASRGEEFDIYEMFQGLTMDVIGRTAFGVQTNAQENEESPFVKAAKFFFEMQRGRLIFALVIAMPSLDYIFYPFRRIFAIIDEYFGKHAIAYLFNVCQEVIDRRRRDPSLRRNDLLQLMLDAKMSKENLMNMKNESLDASKDVSESLESEKMSTSKKSNEKVQKLTDEEIEANAFVFLLAGFETTSTALAYVIHVLINYPDVQERVRQEVMQLYEADGKIDYNVVTKLQYMEQVINEAMRMYPPVTVFVTRQALEDYKVGDMTIPKGAYVQAPIYTLHRDPELWHQPEKFDPERFSPENRSKISQSAFQPFGQGPRNCIGMRFALLEAKHTLARILMKYRLELCPKSEVGDIKVTFKLVTMTPTNGVYVRAVPI